MNKITNANISKVASSVEHSNLLYNVLQLTLQDNPLDVVLGSVLEELLAVSWLKLLPKGGIFLVDDTKNTLKLTAGCNLGPQITSLCDRVPFGHCLCGRAAAQGQTQHASCIDGRHEVQFDGIAPHGHYNVPIKTHQNLVGVIVVYLTDGHKRNEAEVEFLERFADVLALLISAKQSNEKTLLASELLRDSEVSSAAMMNTIWQHMIVSKTSISGKITHANDAFCEISGYRRSELVGAPHRIVNSGVHPESFWRNYWETISAGKSWHGEVCNKRKDGSFYWADSIVMPIKNSKGQTEEYISIRTDITDRKKAEDALVRTGKILDGSSNEIYVFEVGSLKYTQLNIGARRNLGYDANEVNTLSPISISPEFTAASFMKKIQPLIDGEVDDLSFETLHLRKDGSRYPIEMKLHYDTNEHPPVCVGVAQDITERKESEREIERLAFYDSLTGLANRALMTDRLQQAISRATRLSSKIRLLFLDLNRFKEINDTRGHAVGDQVLIEVANRLNSVVRQHETIARIGGDEFVIILESCNDIQAMDVVKRLKEKLALPIRIEGKSHIVGTSVGIASYPENSKSAEVLLQNADIAMYAAKANGGGCRFFDQEMGKSIARRIDLMDRLDQALISGRLNLYYQPIVDLKTGALCSAEGLLRWYEEDLGWISPGEFIPIAEERRMMNKIGNWVTERAVQNLSEWRAKGHVLPGRLAINAATQQLEGNSLIESILKSTAKFDIPHQLLEVEITESSMMHDPDSAMAVLQELSKIGVNTSIDDFGTGYSSLAYLRKFKVNKLKIDMSFIQDLVDDPSSQAIVSATIAMSKGMGLKVLAEGVETEEQAEYLRDLNCDEAQGYLFSKPMPAKEFADKWLKNKSQITVEQVSTNPKNSDHIKH